jgi:hypothetical protein
LKYPDGELRAYNAQSEKRCLSNEESSRKIKMRGQEIPALFKGSWSTYLLVD